MSNLPFGRAIRNEWRLDPDFLTVNHGSYGATPICVLTAQDTWRRQMEAQPSRFMNAILPDALRTAAAALAAFVGATANDLAFVENATGGCNAVLRSLRLAPGDEVLVLDHGYNAVRNTVRFVTERAGARMTEAAIPFPDTTDDAVVAAVAAALTPRTRVAVIDHITSVSALVLPVARIAAACHAVGVPVLVDGAHGPAQIALDVPRLGVDWYTGNCHKWLCAPKGCAFLWAAPDRQDDLHPVIVSHGLGTGFAKEFDWTGTRDPSAYLSAIEAISFHERAGGAAMRARNVALADEAAALVARRLRTDAIPGLGAMRLIRLPPSRIESAALRARLLAAGTDAPVFSLAGGLWLRLSAFAYNEIDDYERLAGIAISASR